jgi:hypothetical protein
MLSIDSQVQVIHFPNILSFLYNGSERYLRINYIHVKVGTSNCEFSTLGQSLRSMRIYC